jgi:energy-coupling factor transporter transmembrane protein EcfT
MNWLEYMDEDTFFHRLSPVTKIIWFVLISVLIAVVRDLPAVTVLFLFMAAVWVRAGLIDRMKMLGRNLFPIMGFAFVMWIVIGALHVDAPDTGPHLSGPHILSGVCGYQPGSQYGVPYISDGVCFLYIDYYY